MNDESFTFDKDFKAILNPPKKSPLIGTINFVPIFLYN